MKRGIDFIKEEPVTKKEYLRKLKRIEKEGYGKTFTSIEELRKQIEG